MITQEQAREIARDLRKRINLAYGNQRGTESYERRVCAETIESLLEQLAVKESLTTDDQSPRGEL